MNATPEIRTRSPAGESVQLLDGGAQAYLFARSRSITSLEASSRLKTWLLDPLGRIVVRLADAMSRVIARRAQRRASPNYSLGNLPGRPSNRPKSTSI